MSLQNIKTSSRGFTIVELLIVVVVIAILAAITIISYNGITSRANASSAASNAETVQKVAEAFNSDGGRYPGSVTEFRNGYTDSTITTAAAKLPTSIDLKRPTVGSGSAGANGTATAAPATVSTSAQLTDATNGITASTGTTRVIVFIKGSTSSSTGGVIVTWDYGNNRIQWPDKYTYYGDAKSTDTFTQLGS